MNLVLEEDIADAFGLPAPIRPLEHIQHTSFETWRLRTASGDYLVKRLWGMEDPFWQPRIATAMEFEGDVLTAGLPIARPVPSRRPAFGYAARIEDLGTIRLYDWIDHRDVGDDDLASWIGTVVAAMHELRPLPSTEQPEWRWWGVVPAAGWDEWIRSGLDQESGWAKVAAERRTFITELTGRIQEAFFTSADQVLSHGDIEPYNVLMASDGPVLIDWESVACESATLEIGRTALAFGAGETGRTCRVLQAYTDAGGKLAPIGDDLFLRSVSLSLCHIAERIGVMVQGDTAPGWMNGQDLDARTADELRALPDLVDQLDHLARICAT